MPNLRAHIVASSGLPPERVGLVQRGEVPFNAHGDNYIYLRLESSTFDQPDVKGAGRIDLRWNCRFSVTIRSRLALDESNMDWLWLTDEALGHVATIDMVLEALTMYAPEDADRNLLVAEPIRPLSVSRPAKELGNEQFPNKEWGESVILFEMVFEQQLDQGIQ